MNKRQINAILFLISILIFSGCVSENKQSSSKNETTIKPQAIRVSTADIDSAEPAIASAKDGIFVLWVEHKTDKEANVVIRQFDFNGQPKSEKVRVNPQEGQAKSWRGDPPTLKIGQDGTLYVGWTAKVVGAEGAANTLYLSVSRDGGRSFESPVKINDDTAPASHGMHSLAVDNSGHIYFTWLDERYLNSRKAQAGVKENLNENYHFEKAAFFHHHQEENKPEPNAELYFAVSNDNGKTFSPNKRLAENVCPCCKTSLLTTNDGRIYASWRQVLTGEFRHIAVASSTDNGNSFSSPVIVSDDKWQISACPVSGASLANSNGDLNVVWFTAGEAGPKGLYMAESKDGGKTFSQRILISESAISGTPVLLNGDTARKRIVWEDNGKLMIASLQDKNQSIENKQEIGKGELVSAAISREHLFISYVNKENNKRAVWLTLINN